MFTLEVQCNQLFTNIDQSFSKTFFANFGKFYFLQASHLLRSHRRRPNTIPMTTTAQMTTTLMSTKKLSMPRPLLCPRLQVKWSMKAIPSSSHVWWTNWVNEPFIILLQFSRRMAMTHMPSMLFSYGDIGLGSQWRRWTHFVWGQWIVIVIPH